MFLENKTNYITFSLDATKWISKLFKTKISGLGRLFSGCFVFAVMYMVASYLGGLGKKDFLGVSSSSTARLIQRAKEYHLIWELQDERRA